MKHEDLLEETCNLLCFHSLGSGTGSGSAESLETSILATWDLESAMRVQPQCKYCSCGLEKQKYQRSGPISYSKYPNVYCGLYADDTARKRINEVLQALQTESLDKFSKNQGLSSCGLPRGPYMLLLLCPSHSNHIVRSKLP